MGIRIDMDDGYADRDADWMARTARDVTAKDIRDAAACKAEFAERMAAHRPIDAPMDDGHIDGSHEGSGAIVAYVVLVLVALGLAFAGLAIVEAFK